MSEDNLNASTTTSVDEPVELPRLAQAPTGWYSKSVNWLAEWFSSISVKETRQSLKSYQFFGTYLLLVTAVSLVTILVFVSQDFNRSYRYDGIANDLFYAYLMILGLPLCVIIPFSAYRSLSREYEDGTIQLIFITTMKPYQIVLGKLGTAMMQMVIYLSVVAPCIAIIYMLEGITFSAIALALGFAVLGCVVLTIFGLLLAGAFKSSAGVMAVSTIFVLGLGALYLGWWSLVDEFVGNSNRLDNFFFGAPSTIVQVMLFGWVAFIGSTACLMLAAAASQISFPADNRSTPVRLVLLLQLPLFLAMLLAPLPGYRMGVQLPNAMMAIAVFIAHYWMIVGFMMAGEQPGVSRRVQRSLPTTFVGRSLKSLLMPGVGRGFLFVLACALGCTLAGLLIGLTAAWLPDWAARPWTDAFEGEFGPPGMARVFPDFEIAIVSTVKMGVQLLYGLGFVAMIFLCNAFIRWASPRWQAKTNVVLTTVLGGLLLFGSVMASLGIWQLRGHRHIEYGSFYRTGRSLTFEESLNWYIVDTKLFEEYSLDTLLVEMAPMIPVLVFLIAMILIAFVFAIRELKIAPITAPSRVVEDIEQERKVPVELPPGESIDEILGILPEQE